MAEARGSNSFADLQNPRLRATMEHILFGIIPRMEQSFVAYEALMRKLNDGRPVGLLSQQTSPLGEMLHERLPKKFKSVFSAEHGYFGLAAPGEKTSSLSHPRWNIPVFSLYGDTRKPTAEMFQDIKRIVVDLQDIGVRCYTYLASLKLVMEAAAEHDVEVIVLDRPVPLGGIVDGPMPSPDKFSFVCPAMLPLCHGMTIGEEAKYLSPSIPRLKLSIVKMRGWSHAVRSPWPNFLPPSPGIRSWDSAVLYPLTVFTEAFPALDTDRSGNLAFRVLGSKWMAPQKLIGDVAEKMRGFGVSMREYRWNTSSGVLLSVESINRYRPVAAGMTMLNAIKARWPEQLAVGARDEWLTKLMGGTSLSPEEWRRPLAKYARERVNLYPKGR